MPLIEAALAFAITMLALSLIVSSFVELIHRAFKMREAGLEHMLRQLFDQVLAKYVKPLADVKEKELGNDPKHKGKPAAVITRLAYEAVRDGFVERMTANRAPVGLNADPTLAVVPQGSGKPRLELGNIWGGRRVTHLAATDFMERLGSDPVGDKIANEAGTAQHVAVGIIDVVLGTLGQKFAGTNISVEINNRVTAGMNPAAAAVDVLKTISQKPGPDLSEEVKKAAAETGQAAADGVETILKDIAQKFDGFGKDAASYFEGRARFISVMVAIVLAFAVHVDAVDLFKTYLRDPNARAKAIEQSQAVAAQYRASQEAVAALKGMAPTTGTTAVQPASKPGESKAPDPVKSGEDPTKPATTTPGGASAAAPETTTIPVDTKTPEQLKAEQEASKAAAKKADDIKKEVEALENDTRKAIADAYAVAKKYGDLGVPLGWNDDRLNAANMKVLLWSCKQFKKGQTGSSLTTEDECKADEQDYKGAKGQQYKHVYLQVPQDPTLLIYLVLGGLLIGLGSPFWYDAVTALTNLRGGAKGATGSDPQAQAAAATAAKLGPPAADKAQPVTPVGAFHVSNAARTP